MDNWEKLLKDQFPCDVCLIKIMCSKSFVEGSACDMLKERLVKLLKERQTINEKKKLLDLLKKGDKE